MTAAVAFVWLGMVLAISFLETPLRFRAPGVTVPVGLAIGRVVFRALNRVEALLLVLAAIGTRRGSVVGLVLALAALLIVQAGVLRPALTRRSDRVLAGEELPRSRAHHGYVGLEVVKVVLLGALGWAALP